MTHGTDTMEETCYLTDLLLRGDRPAVFTGAQRTHDDPHPDGPRNILSALCTAASPAARGLGALLCFNDRIHAARDVTKVHASAVETFQSYGRGAVGEVDGDRVVIHRCPCLRRTFEIASLEDRVHLVRLFLGVDIRLIDALVDAGLFRLLVPREFDGLEADPATIVDVCEELSFADGSVGWAFAQNTTVSAYSAYLDPEYAVPLARARAAAGMFAPLGVAHMENGGFRVSGSYPFGSGCGHAEFMGGSAMVMRDGEMAKLTGGSRDVLERKDGHPTRIRLQLEDDCGRSLEVEGRGRNALGMHRSPNAWTWNCLTEWQWDGLTAWGEDHDNWSAAGVRKFLRGEA